MSTLTSKEAETSAGFTPGPWDLGGRGTIWGDAGTTRVCDLWMRPHLSTTFANARLIAASPDLLGSLSALLEHYRQLVNSGDAGNWDPEREPVVKDARAAIAKALGLSGEA